MSSKDMFAPVMSQENVCSGNFAPVISPSTEVEAKSPKWRNVIAANCFCILGDDLVDDDGGYGGLLYTGKQTISLTIVMILTKNLLYIGKTPTCSGFGPRKKKMSSSPPVVR